MRTELAEERVGRRNTEAVDGLAVAIAAGRNRTVRAGWGTAAGVSKCRIVGNLGPDAAGDRPEHPHEIAAPRREPHQFVGIGRIGHHDRLGAMAAERKGAERLQAFERFGRVGAFANASAISRRPIDPDPSSSAPFAIESMRGPPWSARMLSIMRRILFH